jgi:integrase
LLEGLVTAGKPVLANRVQALVSMVFNFAIDADLMQHNPCTRLRRRGAEVAGTRVLTDDELRLFWSAIINPPASPLTGLALRLQLLTAARPGEVAGLALAELEQIGEPGRAVWIVPASRTKNRRAHLVPLSEPARQIILDAQALAGGTTAYLFPSPTGGDKAIDPHALARAMLRFARALDPTASAAAKTWGANPPTPHDLRRTAATRLAALGVGFEDRAAVLNHVIGGVTKAHYDAHDRAAEKRNALERWAAALSRILEQREPDKIVVPLQTSRRTPVGRSEASS